MTAQAFRSRAFGLVIFFALLAPAAAQETFTPDHVARLRSVASVAISPDGSHVAYVQVVPREPFEDEDGPAWNELHVVSREGESRPYVAGKSNVSAVSWRPDGGAISFLAKREGDEHRGLYSIPLSGGEARKIVAHETDIRSYSWAPDGKSVAFLAVEPKTKDEEELENKGFNQIIFEEDWRPVRIWRASVDGGEPRRLEHEGSASSLHFGPDGARLAVALAPTSLVDDALMNRRVHILDADEGTVLARIDNPGKLGEIQWSPDGRHLAVISAADPNDPAAGRLTVVSASGGELTNLLPGYDDGHIKAAAWRDEHTLLFLASEGVQTFLARVGVDGSELERLLPKEGAVLSGLSISRDGKTAAFRGETWRHPDEVFLVDETGELERLTESNPWLDDMRFAEQEVVTFEARDGLGLQGILIHPLDEEPGRRYPLILTVHGGPESHYANGWLTRYSSPGQVGAARGYAVFYPNYRGSTGRGVEFSKSGHADAAGPEFADLVDAVDRLVEMGLVDRDRVGITGGSYGGYASAWGATYYSERFAAAVMFVGISDNVSKVGTTDIPYEMFMVHHRKWLYDDWNYFLKRSPIYYVKQARTPILILHGKEDPRVHPSQSMELYRHLKTLGQTPVRLVFYPGEGHGNRRAASRYDYHLRMLRWMDHYLKGPGGEPPDFRLDYGRKKEDEPTQNDF